MLDPQPLGGGAARLGRLHRGEGAGAVSRIEQRLRQDRLADRHPGPLGDDGARQLDGAAAVAGAAALERGEDLAVELAQALGIVVGTVIAARRRLAGEVAECGEPRLVLGRRRPCRGRRGRRPGRFRRQQRRQLTRLRAALVDPVRRLGGIGGEVVELGERQGDQLSPTVDQAAQRRPAAVERRGESLEVALFALVRRREERAARPGRRPGGSRHAGGSEQRREEVDVPRRPRVAAGSDPRSPEQQRHVERRLVGEDAVGELAMVAERLAMVGGERSDDRARRRGGELVEERREEGVRGRNLAEVGLAGEARGEGRRWRVGRVRIEQVHPEEARARRLAPPGQRRGDDLVAAPLGEREVGVGPLRIAVVVALEAAVEAEERVERISADEGAGRIARVVQRGRQGRDLRRQAVARVVAHAVLERVQAGEDVGVRRQGHDVVGVGIGVDAAARREPVEARRRRRRAAVPADRVPAQRVDRDQDDVRVLGRPRAGEPGERQRNAEECPGKERQGAQSLAARPGDRSRRPQRKGRPAGRPGEANERSRWASGSGT